MRADHRIDDGDQLLLCMNEDSDIAHALKSALANALTHRVVLGYEQSGTPTVLCLAVAKEIEAQSIVPGTRWSWCGIAQVIDLRALGYPLMATGALTRLRR